MNIKTEGEQARALHLTQSEAAERCSEAMEKANSTRIVTGTLHERVLYEVYCIYT